MTEGPVQESFSEERGGEREAETSRREAARRAGLGLAWVAASGCRAALSLLPRLGVLPLWNASVPALCRAGMAPDAAARFAARRRACPLEALLTSLQASGQRFVPHADEDYPVELAQLASPPAGLFLSAHPGAWSRVLAAPRVTIVGTRRASDYGLRVADLLGRRFARAGVVVLSGLALGIDARAHHAALAAGGQTVGVVGCGVDVVYPRRHRDLRARVLSAGAVLGELPPGTDPFPWAFPLRNRLLAALGDAVIVVEAGARSGALITVEVAAELGRPVFAAPGPILGDTHLGCNRLLYEGASPVLDPDEVLEDFLRLTRMERGPRRARGGGPGAPVDGDGSAIAPADRMNSGGNDRVTVIAALRAGERSVDQLLAETEIPVGELLGTLSRLELEGEVHRGTAGTYVRAPTPPGAG